MKTLRAVILCALCAALTGGSGQVDAPATRAVLSSPTTTPAPAAIAFRYIDIVIDSGEKALAAYQFELTATAGDVTLVGIEGGDHPAFNAAPYYDAHALLQSRVVVAAFSTAADLPQGRSRVARLHLQVSGSTEPVYASRLAIAGDAAGVPIAGASLSVIADGRAISLPPAGGVPRPTSSGSLP